jgi:hypothetical protein
MCACDDAGWLCDLADAETPEPPGATRSQWRLAPEYSRVLHWWLCWLLVPCVVFSLLDLMMMNEGCNCPSRCRGSAYLEQAAFAGWRDIKGGLMLSQLLRLQYFFPFVPVPPAG